MSRKKGCVGKKHTKETKKKLSKLAMEDSSKIKKLRLSWSLCNLWHRGEIDNAVQAYFHIDRPITRQMKEGKELHDKVGQYIQRHTAFPKWFFDYKLETPESEKEVVVSYNEYFDLKGYFDCYDSTTKTLFEFKTGKTDSLTWSRSWQIPIYFLLGELKGLEIQSAFLIRYNQYIKETDFCIVHNSKELRDSARNFIDSNAVEIREFFLINGLI